MMRMLLERGRNDFLKPAFDVKRRLTGRQGYAVRDAENMRIDGDHGFAESDIQDHIGCLAANAGKRFERFAVCRNLAPKILDEPLRQGDDVLCLGAVKADRLDHAAELFLADGKHFFRAVGEGKKRARGLVDAGIGRLRRKHDRNEKSKRIDIVEFAFRVRIGGFEAAENFGDPCWVRL